MSAYKILLRAHDISNLGSPIYFILTHIIFFIQSKTTVMIA